MKQISKKEMELLLENNILHNSNRGMINKHGQKVAFNKSRNKRFIEDRYANIAQCLYPNL